MRTVLHTKVRADRVAEYEAACADAGLPVVWELP